MKVHKLLAIKQKYILVQEAESYEYKLKKLNHMNISH